MEGFDDEGGGELGSFRAKKHDHWYFLFQNLNLEESLATYFASRFTSLALRIPPFGASNTLRHVSSFSGSIRGILTVKLLVYFIDVFVELLRESFRTVCAHDFSFSAHGATNLLSSSLRFLLSECFHFHLNRNPF
uniref:(northern house mosquito) hypothetical protein n=1 Tax=Culex pipiens TaxID=7175 RepID=A0A8D8BHQ3_CULPI